MNTSYPQKFFGAEVRSIRTADDAVAALDSFIRNASDREVEEAIHELEHMVNRPVREMINQLLWRLEYDLSSKAFLRCFNLKYASA